jgi:hypothetical protein
MDDRHMLCIPDWEARERRGMVMICNWNVFQNVRRRKECGLLCSDSSHLQLLVIVEALSVRTVRRLQLFIPQRRAECWRVAYRG